MGERWPSVGRRPAVLATLAVACIGVAVMLAVRGGPPVDDTAAAAEVPPMLTDALGDCPGCAAGEELVGLGLVIDDDGTALHLAFAGPPTAGGTLWLWFERYAPHPAAVVRTADGWEATVPAALPFTVGDLAVESDGAHLALHLGGSGDLGPVAVVSSGGQRVPEVGYATAGEGAPSVAAVDGGLAAEVEAMVATVQAGFPSLDDAQRDHARAVLARQLSPGTSVYDLSFSDRPELRLRAAVSVRPPELAQHISAEIDGEPVLAQSIFVLDAATTVCTWLTDGSAVCAEDTFALPIAGLVGMVADPDAVIVEPVPAREVAGEVAACWHVVASVDDGPPEGETCALPDGTLAVNDNHRTGHRIVLTDRRPDVADGAFETPEGAGP